MITGLSDSTALKTDIILELKSLYGLSNTDENSQSVNTVYCNTQRKNLYTKRSSNTSTFSGLL